MIKMWKGLRALNTFANHCTLSKNMEGIFQTNLCVWKKKVTGKIDTIIIFGSLLSVFKPVAWKALSVIAFHRFKALITSLMSKFDPVFFIQTRFRGEKYYGQASITVLISPHSEQDLTADALSDAILGLSLQSYHIYQIFRKAAAAVGSSGVGQIFRDPLQESTICYFVCTCYLKSHWAKRMKKNYC